MTNFLYGYRNGSRSVAALRQRLNIKTIRRENSKFKGAQSKSVINWGASQLPEEVQRCGRILNPAAAVALASNKLNYFRACTAAGEDSPSIPDYTTERNTAAGWFAEKENTVVFARTRLTGNSGEGIVKINSLEELNRQEEGTLLVRYIPKRREFRLHTSTRGVFRIQEKLRRNDVPLEEVDYQIRSHDNGFVFAQENIELPNGVRENAARALSVAGLDFGAVDIIYNERQQRSYVLEVNSAPGLEGSTIDYYESELGALLNEAA